MPPLAPSSAPSLPSQRFRNVSNRQYMLSTFDPVTGSVSTSFPQTTPTCGSLEPADEAAERAASIIVLASDRTAISPGSFGMIGVEHRRFASILAVNAKNRTDRPRTLDDVDGAIAAAVRRDDELELVLRVVESEQILDALADERSSLCATIEHRDAGESRRRPGRRGAVGPRRNVAKTIRTAGYTT